MHNGPVKIIWKSCLIIATKTCCLTYHQNFNNDVSFWAILPSFGVTSICIHRVNILEMCFVLEIKSTAYFFPQISDCYVSGQATGAPCVFRSAASNQFWLPCGTRWDYWGKCCLHFHTLFISQSLLVSWLYEQFWHIIVETLIRIYFRLSWLIHWTM